MASEFHLPELGENIDNVEVIEVLVSVGDTIAVDDPVIEVETDKASLEVPSSVAGVVKEIKVAAGASISIGSVVLTVEAESEAGSGDSSSDGPQEQASQSKASTESSKPQADAAPVATRSAPSEPRAKVDPSAPSAPVEPPSRNGSSAGERRLAPAAPSTRRLAREIGVDIARVKGSGPKGRISIEDVKAFAKTMLAGSGAPASSVGAVAVSAPLPDFSRFGSVRVEKMSGIRRKTAEQMNLAWSTIPQVTQFDKADITDLEAMRKKLNAADPKGAKITVTAILLKILASALKRFPQFNASIDMANQEIVYKEYHHLGVAVDTDRGLLVPVVFDVPTKNIKELAADLTEIAEKARNKKIRPEDLQGSCITITNLGGIGGHAFTPIVNPPEVAILGVSRASMEPVYDDGTFYPRLMMPLCLSYDHRLIDGADAARFLRWVCEALENPGLVAFEG